VANLAIGPKQPQSTVLSIEEAVATTFRRHILLPSKDCLHALQAAIPHLMRSSLHRSFQRYGISHLPEAEDDKSWHSRFKRDPIGYFQFIIAKVEAEEGRLYLFVAIDRTSKFAL